MVWNMTANDSQWVSNSWPRTSVQENGFTVDLEDWFHGLELPSTSWSCFESRIEASLSLLLDLLSANHVRATFFVLGPVAERFPQLVRDLARAGHEIGTHGYSHQFVYRQSPQQFETELRRSKDMLEDMVSQPVRSHRAAFFSITLDSLWALDILAAQGIRYDSSVFPVVNYRYGIPGAPRQIHRILCRQGDLIEFPPSTIRFFGVNVPVCGGAYFRILPYWFTRLGLRKLNAAGQPAIFYIHPWELDPAPPHFDLPKRISLTHYWNLTSAAARLKRLLRDFRFTALRDLQASVSIGCTAVSNWPRGTSGNRAATLGSRNGR